MAQRSQSHLAQGIPSGSSSSVLSPGWPGNLGLSSWLRSRDPPPQALSPLKWGTASNVRWGENWSSTWLVELKGSTSIFSREELGKNINADEAAAMGAVYQAAALSKAFKVKPFIVRDAAVYPIQVRGGRSQRGRAGCWGMNWATFQSGEEGKQAASSPLPSHRSSSLGKSKRGMSPGV